MKIFENKSKYFPKIFLHKIPEFFFRNFCAFRAIFATRGEKKKKKQPTDQPYTWQVLQTIKQGFFCFFFSSWPYLSALIQQHCVPVGLALLRSIVLASIYTED